MRDMKVMRRPEFRFLTLTFVGNNLTLRGGSDRGGGAGGSPPFVTQLNLTVVEIIDLSGGRPGDAAADGLVGQGQGQGVTNASRRALYDPEGAALYICAVVLVYGLSMVLLIASFAKTGNHPGRSTTSGYDESQTHKYLRAISSLKERGERDIYRQLKRNIIIRVKQSPSGSRDPPPLPSSAAAAASVSAAGGSLPPPTLQSDPHSPTEVRTSAWIQIEGTPPTPSSPSPPDDVFEDDGGDLTTTCSPDVIQLPSSSEVRDPSLLTADRHHQRSRSRSRSFDCASQSPLSPSNSVQTSPEVFHSNETSPAYWSNSVRLSTKFPVNSVQTSTGPNRSNSVQFSPASTSVQNLRRADEFNTKRRKFDGPKFEPVRYSALVRSDSVQTSDRIGRNAIGRNAAEGRVEPVQTSVYLVGSNSVQRVLSVAMTTQRTRNKNGRRFEPVTSLRRVRLRLGRGGGNAGRGELDGEVGGERGKDEDRGRGGAGGRDWRGIIGGGVTGGGRTGGEGKGVQVRGEERGVMRGDSSAAEERGRRGGGGGWRGRVRPQSLTALVMRPWFADHGKSVSDPVPAAAAVHAASAAADDAESGDEEDEEAKCNGTSIQLSNMVI